MNNEKMMKPKTIKYKIKQPLSDRIFDIINGIVMTLFVILAVVPLIYLFSNAFSDGLARQEIVFLPKVVGEDGNITYGVTLKYFKYIISEYNNGIFLNSFKNTLILTLIVTITSNVLMALTAYPLSKSDFPAKKFVLTFFIITMLFSAGIIPSYILMSTLKLTNSIYGLAIISISNVFNMLLFKTTFEGIPKELEESAKIDGATNLQLFFKIIIPLTLPTFASCCFFTIVGCINSYGGALMFIRQNENAKPMAQIMYELIALASQDQSTNVFLTQNQFSIQAAGIVLSIIPIVAIYPFVVRYIKSGLTLGSVKG